MDSDPTKEQLIKELAALRERLAELEALEAKRKRAEAEVRQSEEKYRTLVENSLQGIFITQGSPFHIVFANPAATSILGYSADEFASLAPEEVENLVDPQDRPAIMQLLGAILAGEDVSLSVKFRAIRKDGRVVWLEASSGLIEYEGRLSLQTTFADITERKRAGGEIQRLREFNESILQTVTEGIAVTDATGAFAFVNPAMAAMVGHTPEELLGQNWLKIVPSDQLTIAQAADERRARGQTDRYELELVRRDGTRVPVLISGTPRFEDDRFAGTLAVFTDISEHKQTEHKVKERQMYLERVLAATPDAVVTLDADHHIVEWNTGAERLFGYSRREVIGRDIDPLVTAHDIAGEAVGFTRRVLSGQDVGPVETIRYRKDGSLVEVIVAGSPILIGDELIGVVAVYTDITARKQAEKARRETEERYRILVETSPYAITVTDLSGTIIIANQRAVEIYGYDSVEEMLGQSVFEFVVPADRLGAEANIRRTLETGNIRNVEYTMLRKDGTAFAADLSASLITDAEGEPTAFIGIVRDITEQKQAQEALQRRMEQLTALGQASQAVTATLEIDQVLAQVVLLASEVVNSDYTSVVLVDEAGQMGKTAENVPGVPALMYRVREQGLTSWLLRTREPLIIEEVEEDGAIRPALGEGAPRLVNPHIAEAGVKSVAGLPLMAKGNLQGVLYLHSLQPGAFSDQLALLTTFANQAAIAIENARLYQAEHESHRRAEALRQAAQAVGSSLELPEILRLILEQLRRVLVYDTASVLIFRDGNTPNLVVGVGYANAHTTTQESRRLLEDSPILRQMASDLQPVMSDDVRQLEGWIWVPGAEHVRSWLGVPLEARGKMIGALMVDNRQCNAFGEKDLEMAQALAQHAAQAIENAQLFGEARHRAAHQEALNAVIAVAAAATDLNELMEAVLDHTLQALGLERGGIWIPGQYATRGLPREIHEVSRRASQTAGLDLSDLSGPIVVEDWQQGSIEGLPEIVASLLTPHGIRAFLTVPILAEGQSVGRLSLAASEPRTWSAEEIALTEAIGRQLGGAVERLRLLQQVQEQARQVQQIIDTVAEGMLLLDAERRVVLANPLAREYLEVLTQASVGEPIARLGNRPLSELLAVPPQGLWHEVEIDFPLHRVFQVIARPMEAGPEKGGWVLTLRDVTQEREIRQRIQRQERLAAVGQLAAGIAHDFNNIMAVMVLYAQMSLRSPNLPPKVRERLMTIDQQAKRATDLIQQILDFSRRAVLERHPLNLRPFLSEQVKLLERTMPENIKITLTCGTNDFVVSADPTRMQQALMNLALNARDAMPTGGSLKIKVGRICLQEGEPLPLAGMEAGEWVWVRVSDTGTGISPDLIPHVFEPFFTTRAPLGSGLGLAQVYGIVKQHDGHIDVESKVGEGTTFTLYLPALTLHQPEIPMRARSVLLKGQGQTILVVEDDATTLAALAESLQVLNYRVLEASNGQEALAVFEGHQNDIDLILSDLVMPEMGGMELLHLLQQRDPTVRVVLLTGHLMEDTVKSPKADGVADWLQKPVSLEQLAKVVARVLKVAP